MNKTPFTKKVIKILSPEQNDLKTKRIDAVVNLRTLEMGDLSENAAYKVARQNFSLN